MTWLPWVLVAVCVGAVAWLLLALHGADRTIAELRAAGGVGEVSHLSAGIAPGRRAPAFAGTSPDGGRFRSQELSGMRHLIVFADPGCVSCTELVPDVLRAARARRSPFVALVSRGRPEDHPDEWRASERSRLVIEDGTDTSDAFGVDVTPTVFVIDEGGWVVARDIVRSADDVADLVAEADGVRIVGEASADG